MMEKLSVFGTLYIIFTSKLKIRCTSQAWFVKQQAQTWGGFSPPPSGEKPSALFSFPMTSVRGGRQDCRETRGLIGRADGNALKVRSAWGIDRRPRPDPRWELCGRSFISLRAICYECREEYKEGESERARESVDKGWLIMFSVIYLLTTSLLLF